MAAQDITGQRFGRLVALRLERRADGRQFWRCACDCGAERVVNMASLKKGNTRSCGCLNSEMASARLKTHGQSRTSPLYQVWHGMRCRCLTQTHYNYENYGGRGIAICDEWSSFEAFEEWSLASGYESGLSIDRIDNDGNYAPSNCRWTTVKEQARNRRSTVLVTYNGLTASVAEHAERHPFLEYHHLQRRLKWGWSIQEAFETPPIKGRPHVSRNRHRSTAGDSK